MPIIYCVEDDESIRELILYALRSSSFEPYGFENSIELSAALYEQMPDLVLLDIMLPGEDGLKVLSGLRESRRTCKIPVILLTAKTTEYDKVKGLDLGADDYITKPFGVMELLSRIRAVLRRAKVENGGKGLLSIKNISLNYEKRTVIVNDVPCSLTYKEFELLYYLMRNSGIVLSRDKIMEAVWGFDFEGESRTVDMHIKTLRQKLSRCGGEDIIMTVRSVGYKIEG